MEPPGWNLITMVGRRIKGISAPPEPLDFHLNAGDQLASSPAEEPPMRLPMLAAALSLSLGLTGCGGDPEPTGPGPDVPQAATTTALTFIHVTTGAMHSCGVTSDHRAWCWGDNERGQQRQSDRDQTLTNRKWPVAIIPPS
jgi:hypothetical protein